MAAKRKQKRPVKNKSLWKVPADKKIVLHLGCEDAVKANGLENRFKDGDWHEVRASLYQDIKAGIYSGGVKLPAIPDQSCDAIWLSHKLDRFLAHEGLQLLQSCKRVLKKGGMILLTVPDLKTVGEKIYKDGIHTTLYSAGGHDITAADIIYGFQPDLKAGKSFVQHKHGYTPRSMLDALKRAKFEDCKVQRDGLILWAQGSNLNQPSAKNPRGKIINDDVNELMKKRDALDVQPQHEVDYS